MNTDIQELIRLCDRIQAHYNTFSNRKNDARWWFRAKELCIYYQEHYDANIPSTAHNSLSIWLSTQRRNYKVGKLSPNSDRAQILSALGVFEDFNERSLRQIYELIRKAIEAKQSDTPRKLTNRERCAFQKIRRAWRSNKLPEEWFIEFDNIGFEWSNPKTTLAELRQL